MTSLIRTVPAGAVTITSFELISRHLNSITAALAETFEEDGEKGAAEGAATGEKKISKG